MRSDSNRVAALSRALSVARTTRNVIRLAELFGVISLIEKRFTMTRSSKTRRALRLLPVGLSLAAGGLVLAADSMLRRNPSPALRREALPEQTLLSAPVAPIIPAEPVDTNRHLVTNSPPSDGTVTPGALLALVWAAAKAWSDRRASSKGAALALYTLLSLAPILILVLAGAALFIDPATVQDQLLVQMKGLMGPAGADAVRTILVSSHKSDSGVIAGTISAAVLLFSATTAFGELKDSLDELWEVKKPDGSGVWLMVRERFLSVGLLLVLALMLLFSLALSAGLAAISSLMGDTAATLLGKAGAAVITYLAVTVLFAAIFKFLPAAAISWKDVWIGALLTGALFLLGKTAIGFYLAHGGVSSAYGAAGSVVALVIWIYYSAQIFFYGSLFTHGYAVRFGSRQRDPSAQPLL